MLQYACIGVAGMLLLALAPWPYGYYTLLRIAVCGTGVWCALWCWEARRGWAIGAGMLAVLFNPLIPIYLNREAWQGVDVVSAVFFGLYAVTQRPKEQN